MEESELNSLFSPLKHCTEGLKSSNCFIFLFYKKAGKAVKKLVKERGKC